MSPKVDLYDTAYANYELDVYRQIRIETYGQDLGQTSWVTAEESSEIPRALEVSSDSLVLEIGCGSGRYALRLAEMGNCRLIALDVNSYAIRNANEMARRQNLNSRVRFEQRDVSDGIPFDDETFESVFSNDVLCHIASRRAVLHEIFRVLKPGGRLLFSDALIIGGMISQEEIATRSSIGYYVFSVPGENERLIEDARFCLVRVTDTTEGAAAIAKRWHAARQKRKAELMLTEGDRNFEGVQRFLSCVYTLTCERRLLRCVYVARKEA
jgi:SAM-dependent methyltransferase